MSGSGTNLGRVREALGVERDRDPRSGPIPPKTRPMDLDPNQVLQNRTILAEVAMKCAVELAASPHALPAATCISYVDEKKKAAVAIMRALLAEADRYIKRKEKVRKNVPQREG